MSKPAWMEVDQLFARYGQPPLPYRLRDELVMWLLAHRAAQSSEAPTPMIDRAEGERRG